ncbi:MAG TPA: bacterial transcriptional activator domain-containing protein, partial [Candidatus Elarobacter sp.]|nr:bacterial transcriptional activator domain-containing protein [Candidatus Elarobacter sp.]
DAMALARDVMELDPLDEGAYELMIRGLTESGDIDAARRTYARYAAALQDELSAEPSKQLADLVRRIR